MIINQINESNSFFTEKNLIEVANEVKLCALKTAKLGAETIDTLTIQLNFFCIETEKQLNLLGYIPFISSFSGRLRSYIGDAQIIISLAGLLFRGTEYHFTKQSEPKKMAHFHAVCIREGLGNYFRGYVEAIPVLGNVSTFVYDEFKKTDF